MNRLANEKSPYLLQHKDNPVNWYPWGAEAFEAAKAENKAIFLSIGYSTCYWCHVMEKESFENQEVADVLNKHFISIKVDREERPDIDSIYMNAVVALSGHGGWPMSVFLTPELKPFFGGTYFPRVAFVRLLERVAELWSTQREDLDTTALQLTEAIKADRFAQAGGRVGPEAFETALMHYERNFDSEFGGFSQAPKFPASPALSLLFRIFDRTQNTAAKDLATYTLDCMARGGIYDHLGGGFHRYSTDRQWLVPHFEKMLYDNAQLASVYLEAYQLTKDQVYSHVARETLNYVLRDMTSEDGGFYSAEDAGEVGKEGEYYVWTYAALKDLLSAEELAEVQKLYGASEDGNFEHGTNILNFAKPHQWSKLNNDLIRSARRELVEARYRRLRPHRDDKILTSWNALMISAMAKGYQVLEEPTYLHAAQKAASFIRQNLYREGRILRRYRDGDARFPGYLDDYAFLIQGLINLYESDFNSDWLSWAIELQAILDDAFWDEGSAAYLFSDGSDPSVINRRKELMDNAEPSGNSISAQNLVRLYHFTLKRDYKDRAERILNGMAVLMNGYPTACASSLIALDMLTSATKEIAIVGDAESRRDMLDFLYQHFLPNKIIAAANADEISSDTVPAILRGKEQQGSVTYYVCRDGACQLPTSDFDLAKKLIEER